MRFLRALLGLLLLPVGYAATRALLDLVSQFSPERTWLLAPPEWALAGGFALWLLLYATMPRPMRAYVLAHELTHALCGLLCGARVSKLRISSEGGSVGVSKTNIVILLAPYFCPLYTILVAALYGLGSLWWDWRPYYLWWLGLIGLTWSFHLTFTLNVLLQRQSDIQRYGHLFSYALIYLLNLLALGLGLVAVGPATLRDLGHGLTAHAGAAYLWCGQTALAAWNFCYAAINGRP